MIEGSAGTRPVRVAVLNTHPIQYFAPLYAYLKQTLPEMQLVALYCSDYSLRGAVDTGFSRTVQWDIDLLAGYDHQYLGQAVRRRTPRGFWSLIVPEVWTEIRSGRHDVLWLHGYGYFACVLAFLAAKSMGMPVMLRGETHLSLNRSGWRRHLRDGVLRQAFRWVDGFLAIGRHNRDYYRKAGVPETRIFDVPYAVDNERFMAASDICLDQRARIRQKLGIETAAPVVLYASKLVERKHPHTLLKAVRQVQQRGVSLGVCVVGSGPMEGELRALAGGLALTDCSFPGFVNQSELPAVYAACEMFVLAAESEPWGLVVNEVMCAGLPVVIGDEVGCADDLVEPGVNGFHVEAGNVDALAEALLAIASNAELRRHMGAASRERISRWGFRQCASGLQSALHSFFPTRIKSPDRETWN